MDIILIHFFLSLLTWRICGKIHGASHDPFITWPMAAMRQNSGNCYGGSSGSSENGKSYGWILVGFTMFIPPVNGLD